MLSDIFLNFTRHYTNIETFIFQVEYTFVIIINYPYTLNVNGHVFTLINIHKYCRYSFANDR
jgi:hypothetical protein